MTTPHIVAALHHENLSRSLAVRSLLNSSSQNAVRLEQVIGNDSPCFTSNSLYRQALWGGEIEGISARQSDGGRIRRRYNTLMSASASGKVDVTSSIDDSLPTWYALHNPHCCMCGIPLIFGMNSCLGVNTDGYIINCEECGELTHLSRPSVEKKRQFRSCRVRNNHRDTYVPTQTSAKLTSGKHHPTRDLNKVDIQSNDDGDPKQTDVSSKSAKEKHASVAEGENKSLPKPATIDQKMKKRSRNAKHDSRKMEIPKKPDKQALRALLSANRKRKSSTEESDTPQAESSLGDFLSSL